MPTQIEWFLENRIILHTNSGILTLEEHRLINQQTRRLLIDGTAPIHIISDNRELSWIGSIASTAMSVTQNYAWLNQSKLGYVILVGTPRPSERGLINGLLGNFKASLQIVTSIEEALTYLREQDETLPDPSD